MSTTLTHPNTEQIYRDLERQVHRVGDSLSATFLRLMDALGAARPLDLASKLGINKDLSSRVYGAVKARDGIAAVHLMPGPDPLRKLLRAAKKCGVPLEILDDAARAVDEFHELIRHCGGDRVGLDSLIGTWLPAARMKQEASAKQAMYRGATILKGVAVDTTLVSFLLVPSASDSTRCDTVMLGGLIGLRRLRRGAPAQFTAVLYDPGHDPSLAEKDRKRARFQPKSPLLRQYCSPTNVSVAEKLDGDRVHFELHDHGAGPRSGVDLFLSEFYASNHPLEPGPQESGRRWFYATIEQPSKLLVFDVLIHKEVWPGCDPELQIHDTTVNGVVNPDAPESERARLDVAESYQHLHPGRQGLRLAEIPNYASLLEDACGRLHLDTDAFRAYRARIQHPFYGSQTSMLFSPSRR